jgi:hypothetical protein
VSRAALSCHVGGNRAPGRDGLPVKKSGRRRGKLEQNVSVFLHRQDIWWSRSHVPILRWSCELQSTLSFILV